MVWVFIEKGLYTLLQFVTLIVLGRLLSVEDYGVYGTMIVFIAVSEILIDSGFGGAIIQKKEVSKDDVNTLFTVNLLISVLLYLFIYLSAPLIEAIYDIEGITKYFRVVGLVILFYALSVVQNSLLIREMKFKKSAIINISACILSACCAIILAYYGFGVWALICQTVLYSAIMTLILWITNWISIELRINRNSLNLMWKFGSNLLFSNILTTIANNVSSSIIPKIGTIKQSGLYLQAYKVSNIPSNILTLSVDKSTFPLLSREKTKDALITRARSINRTILTLFTPVFPLLSLYAFVTITVILGEKWIDAVPYFQVLSWGGLALMLQSLSRNIMKSYGDSRTILKVEIIKTMITLSIILVSIQFGINFLVWGITISYYLGAILWMYVLQASIGYRMADHLKDIMRPLLFSISLYIVFLFLGFDLSSLKSLIYIPVYLFIYVLLGVLTKDDVVLSTISKFN